MIEQASVQLLWGSFDCAVMSLKYLEYNIKYDIDVTDLHKQTEYHICW